MDLKSPSTHLLRHYLYKSHDICREKDGTYSFSLIEIPEYVNMQVFLISQVLTSGHYLLSPFSVCWSFHITLAYDKYWTEISFQSITITRVVLSVSSQKMYAFSRWMWKQPSSVKLSHTLFYTVKLKHPNGPFRVDVAAWYADVGLLNFIHDSLTHIVVHCKLIN